MLRYCGEATDAEEVVQETFLRAWRSIGGFQRRAQFFTWLYRIGLNEAKRRAGRRTPADTLSVEEGALDAVAELRQAPEPRAEQHDVRDALERAVRALPQRYRAPLILRDVEVSPPRRRRRSSACAKRPSRAGCIARGLRCARPSKTISPRNFDDDGSDAQPVVYA